MRGKQSGINYGQRKQTAKSDTEQLVAIKQYIKRVCKIDLKREWFVGFTIEDKPQVAIISQYVTNEQWTNHIWKNPDFLFFDEKAGLVIIEIDGAVHLKKGKETKRRNNLYKNAGITLLEVQIWELEHLNIKAEHYIRDWITEKRSRGQLTGIKSSKEK